MDYMLNHLTPQIPPLCSSIPFIDLSMGHSDNIINLNNKKKKKSNKRQNKISSTRLTSDNTIKNDEKEYYNKKELVKTLKPMIIDEIYRIEEDYMDFVNKHKYFHLLKLHAIENKSAALIQHRFLTRNYIII